MTSCPLFSFFHHFWVGATAKQQQTYPKVMTEWKKWATGQSCISKEVTSYKIHTLVMSMMTCSHLHLLNVCTLLTLNQFVYILRVIIVLIQTILRLCTRCLLRFEYQLPHPILSTTLATGKKCALKMIFFNKTFFRKFRIIFDIENWLWKSGIDTFGQLISEFW